MGGNLSEATAAEIEDCFRCGSVFGFNSFDAGTLSDNERSVYNHTTVGKDTVCTGRSAVCGKLATGINAVPVEFEANAVSTGGSGSREGRRYHGVAGIAGKLGAFGGLAGCVVVEVAAVEAV